MAEAASQSAMQYRSIRDALRKARVQEQAAEERERKRRAKEIENEKKRKAAAEKREHEKAEKKKAVQAAKEAAEAEKAAAAAESDSDDEDEAGNKKKRKKRRCRGIDEIGGDDYPVLANRFTGCELPICDSMESFMQMVFKGVPCVWRSKRPQLKKLLDLDGGFDTKKATNTTMALQAELKNFISEFAATVEANPNKLKQTKVVSEENQIAAEALSMDLCFQDYLEKNQDYTLGDDEDFAPVILSREDLANSLQDLFSQVKETSDNAENKEKFALPLRQAEQEANLQKMVQMVAFQRGKQHDGVLSGLFPHLSFQMEGTRVMALVDISEAPKLRLSCCCGTELYHDIAHWHHIEFQVQAEFDWTWT